MQSLHSIAKQLNVVFIDTISYFIDEGYLIDRKEGSLFLAHQNK